MKMPEKPERSRNTSPSEMTLRPVGIIHSKIKDPFLAAGDEGISMQGSMDEVRSQVYETHKEIAEIVIDKDLVDILDGIEEYSHVVIVYWAHKVPEQSRSLTKVHPMGREDIPKVGIFSTCSPARPNPVLFTVGRLCGRKENVLEVAGLDAVDGSPVLDIKPYVKDFYPQQEVLIPQWMQQLRDEITEAES